MERAEIDALLQRFDQPATDQANPRTRAIVNHLMRELCYAIEDFDIQPSEFWSAVGLLADAGRSGELGLIVPGLGLEHFLDMRADEAERKAGLLGGTPRTIEGPLYVAGAPLCECEARLDDGKDDGEPLFMRGQVLDSAGQPVPHALVEVWHANSLGNYSYFDQTQSAFNLRRSIRTDEQGRYRFRSIMPCGYSVPPDGPTDRLLRQLGRHGHRPAHVHFFISSPGFRKLTTQINIQDDPHLWDDFAFGTREGLVPDVQRVSSPEELRQSGVGKPFARIEFNFTLHREAAPAPSTEVSRARAQG
ncbi:catechol 1,2-dioxygenase [Chromobacterium haemolyticum]|uniref:catechol 1,2-dioxygenase n=1 Tax=Chromobacterium haemolyticum TaxID=394935 RepID=UPI0009DB6451|nr:catechol 1,2-dioxygenase [Chromobacterium haemolyticum]OQS34716.1 catechol 1,2-dioxygenase [Chromobacterium haemolyticum]